VYDHRGREAGSLSYCACGLEEVAEKERMVEGREHWQLGRARLVAIRSERIASLEDMVIVEARYYIWC
jgi:hypothetical protein